MEAMLNSRLGRTILGATRVTLGSTSDNQVVLNESGVESRHAEIRPGEQGYSILDLGSSAGTFVNGQRLVPNVPQVLQNGDTIRIANSPLSYEMTSGPAIAPTVYAAPSIPGSDPSAGGYAPTVMAQGGAYPPATSYGSSSGDALYAAPPPPSYLSGGAPPPPAVTPDFNLNDPYGSTTPKKSGRRGLWIALGVLGGVLVLGIAAFAFVATRGPSTTPAQTYQTFCSDVKEHNTQAAYNMYSSNVKKHIKPENATAFFSLATDCTVDKVDDSTTAGSVTFTLTDIGKITEDYKLTSSEDNVWKIDSQQPRPTPTYTLFNFCGDLLTGDFKSAYDLYSKAYQGNTSESDYANGFSSGKPTKCVISSIDDNTGKGLVTLTYQAGSGAIGYDEGLIKENNTWKIDTEQVHSTPTVTLDTFCNALKQKDYTAAYDQLSNDNKSSLSQADFQKAYGNVADCSVSNVDDNAGTGTINYTTTDGKTATADYTLVQENGAWKMKTEKFH